MINNYEKKEEGQIKEVVFENSGHSPQIEESEKFVKEYMEFITSL